jgi:hypothetical protein
MTPNWIDSTEIGSNLTGFDAGWFTVCGVCVAFGVDARGCREQI